MPWGTGLPVFASINTAFLHKAFATQYGFPVHRGGKHNNLPLPQSRLNHACDVLQIAFLHKTVALVQNNRFHQMGRNFLRFMRSKILPVEPMMMRGFSFSRSICLFAPATNHQHTADVQSAVFFQQLRLMKYLCRQLMRGCQNNCLHAPDAQIQAFKNRAKDRLTFSEPVSERPMTSLPDKINGIIFCCISVGVSMPCFASAAIKTEVNPNFSNSFSMSSVPSLF